MRENSKQQRKISPDVLTSVENILEFNDEEMHELVTANGKAKQANLGQVPQETNDHHERPTESNDKPSNIRKIIDEKTDKEHNVTQVYANGICVAALESHAAWWCSLLQSPKGEHPTGAKTKVHIDFESDLLDL